MKTSEKVTYISNWIKNYVNSMPHKAESLVIGIAGGTEKCRWVVNELGFDACLDYKDTSAPLRHQLKAVAPDGVDVYFDNTGGDILQTALFAMKMKGRISCCGAVSMYDGKPSAGPFGVPGLLVTKRLRMEGFMI